jgi:hypothetical protein
MRITLGQMGAVLFGVVGVRTHEAMVGPLVKVGAYGKYFKEAFGTEQVESLTTA